MGRWRTWLVGTGAALVAAGSGFLIWQHQQHVAEVAVETQQAVTGKQLFASMCVTCHGPGGNGAGGAPILNDGSVLQKYSTVTSLAAFIQSNMPASDPGILTSQQSTELALYIFHLNHRLTGP